MPTRPIWQALGGAVALYLIFLVWYDLPRRALTPEETEILVAAVRSNAAPNLAGEATLERLRGFAEQHEGGEFFAVNLVRWRPGTSRPAAPNSGAAVGVRTDPYARFMMLRLLSRACHPVLMGEPLAALLGSEDSEQWDQIAVVRYRSWRDFLEIVSSAGYAEVAEHKWASVEKARTFPVRNGFTLFGPRSLVFLLLMLPVLVLGFSTRRIRVDPASRAAATRRSR